MFFKGTIASARLVPWAGVVVYAALCAIAWGFVVDDAYITFLYARNLVEHGQLVPSPGHFVYGYTNFLYVLCCSGLYALGGPDYVEPLAKLFLMGCGGATIIIVDLILRDLRTPPGPRLIAVLMLSTSTPFVVWTVGALETTLLALCVTLAYHRFLAVLNSGAPADVVKLAGVCLACALIRLDSTIVIGPLLLIAAMYGRSALRARRLTAVLGAFVVPLALFAVFLAFYYGSVLPTSTAKLRRFSMPAVRLGVDNLMSFAGHDFRFLLLPAIIILWMGVLVRAERVRRLLLVPEAAGFLAPFLLGASGGIGLLTAYLVSLGSPHMGFAFRYYVPILPVIYVVIAFALSLWPRLRSGGWTAAVLAVVVLVANLGAFRHAYAGDLLLVSKGLGHDHADVDSDNTNIRGWALMHERWKAAAKHFGPLIPEGETVFCWSAGLFPFFSKASFVDDRLIGREVGPSRYHIGLASWLTGGAKLPHYRDDRGHEFSSHIVSAEVFPPTPGSPLALMSATHNQFVLLRLK